MGDERMPLIATDIRRAQSQLLAQRGDLFGPAVTGHSKWVVRFRKKRMRDDSQHLNRRLLKRQIDEAPLYFGPLSAAGRTGSTDVAIKGLMEDCQNNAGRRGATCRHLGQRLQYEEIAIITL